MPAAGPELGVDVDGIEDHGFVWSTTDGFRNLGNAIARRLVTPRGGLFYDPDYGLDLREYLNEGLTDAGVSDLVNAVEAECRKDNRVQDIDVSVRFLRNTGTLEVSMTIETAEGPFRLVLGIDEVNVTVLNDGLPAFDIAPTPPVAEPQVVQVMVQGPQGPRGDAGPAGAAGASGGRQAIDESSQYATRSDAFEVLYTLDIFDFDHVGGTVTVQFTADVKSPGSTIQGTFRVYVGGTADQVDGTMVAEIVSTANSVSFEMKEANATFANPGGLRQVKIVGKSSTAGSDVFIRAVGVSFS